MAVEAHAPSAGEYIVHHLTHLGNREATGLIDFSVIHWDSVFFSIVLGALGCWVMWLVARSMSAGVPGRLQAAVELLVEMVDREAKGIVHNEKSRRLVAPMALSVFVWVVLLNTMDLLPVDLLPRIWAWMFGVAGHDPEHAYLRVVPTADISVTMGLSISVLLAVLIYSIKIKGLGGWLHELYGVPFGTKPGWAAPLLVPFNLLFNAIEYISKPLSHSLRLFGNMYAGEIMFLLIAMLAAAGVASSGYWSTILGGVFQIVWIFFDGFIALLQAYIFMMLTIAYIAMAHEQH